SSMGQGVAIGYKSFETGMGARNTAIGNYTGTFSGNNVTDNVFVGDGAAYSFSASSRSVCLGGSCGSGPEFTADGDHVAIGATYTCGNIGVTNPGRNICLGQRSGVAVEGAYNVLMG